MTQQILDQKTSDQYRFSGYQLPKIQLDETGPAYYVVQPHPYYYNQPQYWQKPYYQSAPLEVSYAIGSISTPDIPGDDPSIQRQGQLYRILPLNKK